MEAVFGPMSDMDWGTLEDGSASQPPTFKMCSLNTPCLPKENIVKKPPSRSRRRPRPKSSQAVSQLPKSNEVITTAAPTLSSMNSAPSLISVTTTLPASNYPTQSNSIPTLISNYLPNSSFTYHPTVQSSDHIKSALEAFDLLIAPQLIHPPNSTQSSITLRRFLYRKQFQFEITHLIINSLDSIHTVDQLVDIIITACHHLGFCLA